MEKYHPVVTKIRTILEEKNAQHELFVHEPVRTSEEAAAVRSGYTLAQGAKALIVRVKTKEGKKFVMLVVPGDRKFNSTKAKTALKAKDIRFASIEEVSYITEGVEPGGVPPWGNLFNLEVYADSKILENQRIIFNAGDKRVSIGMLSTDYEKLVKPTVVDIAQ